MKLIKNALIPALLAAQALSVTPALAASLETQRQGQPIASGISSPAVSLPGVASSYASIDNPSQRLTFEEMRASLPGVFYNTAEGKPTLDSIFVAHATPEGGDSLVESGETLRQFLEQQSPLKELGAPEDVSAYIDHAVQVVSLVSARTDYLKTPFMTFAKRQAGEPEMALVNLSGEQGVQQKAQGHPSYQRLSESEKAMAHYFMYTHEMAHTHRINQDYIVDVSALPQARSQAGVQFENYADASASLDMATAMHNAKFTPAQFNNVMTFFIEMRNNESLLVNRTENVPFHTHDSDVTLMAAQGLFHSNAETIANLSQSERNALAKALVDTLTPSMGQHYDEDRKALFSHMSPTERASLAMTVANTVAADNGLQPASEIVFPAILQESLPLLASQGFSKMATHNPHNPADSSRLYWQQGDDMRPYTLVENPLVGDNLNVITSVYASPEMFDVTDISFENGLPHEVRKVDQLLDSVFSDHGVALPSVIERELPSGHAELIVTASVSANEGDALSRFQHAIQAFSEQDGIQALSAPVATPSLFSMLDHTLHTDSDLFTYPEVLQQTVDTLFPGNGHAFSLADSAFPDAPSQMPPHPLRRLPSRRRQISNNSKSRRIRLNAWLLDDSWHRGCLFIVLP